MRAWEDFLSLAEKELGKETVKKWLLPFKVVRFDACNLYLEAPDSFKALWFEEHVRHRLHLLINNNNKQIKVHLSVALLSTDEGNQKKATKKPLPTLKPAFQLHFDDIDEKSSFDNFVTSQSNLLAFKLLSESCGNESSLSFNPIYMFGRKGTGKTHLLMAATKALREHGKTVIYIRAETFTEHVVNAIRTGEMQLFRKTYRNVDALLIDDIEVFSRKGATQEEFFHTFNTLQSQGKQIILSANLSPGELKFIEPRLVSRFEWGVVIPLQTLGKEQMGALLNNRASQLKFPLQESAKEFLLETFGNNTKTLIRALEALILRTHLSNNQSPMTLAFLKQVLHDLITEEEKAVLTPGKIIRTVAEYYGIRIDDILSKSQSRETSLPRQIAMHLCRTELNLPYMKIGDIFTRDHSTVMTSVKQIQKGVEEKNHEVVAPLSSIIKRLETH